MQIEVKTEIDQVTVYPDRARVQRTGTCQVEKGWHQFVVGELPIVLETESLRAGGKGSARVRLLGVDLSVQHYDQTPAVRVQELEEAIQALQDELRQLADQRAGWEAHLEYLQGLRAGTSEFAWGLSRGRTKVIDQVSLVQFMQEQDAAGRDAVRAIDFENREKMKRLETLKHQLRELQSARPRRRRQATVEVEVLAAGEFSLALTYVVKNAGWQPLYDVRLFAIDQTHRLGFNLQAEITQNSGENWDDVDLAVSTARPALNQRLPELTPWLIDELAPRRPMMRSQAAPMAVTTRVDEAEMSYAMADPVELDASAPAEIAQATMQSEGTAVTFLLAGKSNIPSDGSPHKALVSEYLFDPQIDYLTVPKHTDAVYRRVKVQNGSGGALLAGPVNLFIDEEYIGQTRMTFTAANAEIEMLLGVESRLFVARELTRRDVDKKLLREQRQLRYGYRIELKNHLAETAVIEVHDHLPLSAHDKIKVKTGPIRPAPSEHSDMNMLEWVLTIPPGNEIEINYEFTIEHPREMRLTGINE